MMKKLTRQSSKQAITRIWHRTLQQALQVECLLCHEPSNHTLVLCDACIALMQTHHTPCRMCALPLNGLPFKKQKPPHAKPQETIALCGDCLKHPKPFQNTYAPLLYQYPVNSLIKLFKLKGQQQLTQFWVQKIIETLNIAIKTTPKSTCKTTSSSSLFDTDTLIVPIPSHRNALARKGFSHSHLLASEMATRLQLQTKPLLYCTRPHINQKTLDKEGRKRNLKSLYRSYEPIQGRSILLVDDVITTGATVTSASLALLEAGAERIDICAIARTP